MTGKSARWIGGAIAAVLLAPIGTAYVVGAGLPREHVARSTAAINARCPVLFSALNDVAHYPSWWRGVQSSEVLPTDDGHARFAMTMHGDAVAYRVLANEPPRQRVTQIDQTDLGYGGTWTVTFEPGGAGCTVTVTENGFVGPPLMRAFARAFMDPHGNIDELLRSLGDLARQEVTPTHID